MLVSDIWEDIKEETGTCDSAVLYRAITRAVEILANTGLFDPLIGTIDFTVDGSSLIALPRDVKTPLRLNIEDNPAATRNRLYEFVPNGSGSVDDDDEGIEWQWHDRGYSAIQDERRLPSRLAYAVDAADVGKTCTIIGLDEDGYERRSTISGVLEEDVEEEDSLSEFTFAEIRNVVREETTQAAYLFAEEGVIARYERDETKPEYRVIKLSKTGVGVRMIYRKHTFKIQAQTDIIPLNSPSAVIRAVVAVRHGVKGKIEESKLAWDEAIMLLKREQESRTEHQSLSEKMEVQHAISANINTSDVVIVADVYDEASLILGPIGKKKIFDRLTDAIEALQNKAQWDSKMGWCDIWKADNSETVNFRGGKGHGYFALPRYVNAVLALNFVGNTGFPRNRWFEYHINGPGEQTRSNSGTWDDVGNTCIINFLPTDPTTKKIAPVKLIAIPESSLDDDLSIVVYGTELNSAGEEIEVYRNGIRGWPVPCDSDAVAEEYEFDEDEPAFTKIQRIKKESSTGFVRLTGVTATLDTVNLGYWYPDELEPSYRLIRVPSAKSERIRIRYSKRSHVISSLNDVINLRSRLAICDMLRSIAIKSDDPMKALQFEGVAVNYLLEEQRAANPHQAGQIQFDAALSTAVRGNIQ